MNFGSLARLSREGNGKETGIREVKSCGKREGGNAQKCLPIATLKISEQTLRSTKTQVDFVEVPGISLYLVALNI